MENRKRETNHTLVIRFRTDDQVITFTFSQEEGVGVRVAIFDILTEADRWHSLIPKQGDN